MQVSIPYSFLNHHVPIIYNARRPPQINVLHFASQSFTVYRAVHELIRWMENMIQ